MSTKNYIILLCAAMALLLLGSCAEDTGTLGIYAEEDGVSTSTDIFDVSTRSLAMGNVIADNTYGYLGRVNDPETNATIEADYAAQFYCLENYSLPQKSLMIENTSGEKWVDSVEVRLYLKSYYGDGNNPMKVEVYPLDKANILSEDSTYYTNIDLSKYVTAKTPLATRVFTPEDYILTEDERTSSSHTANIRIRMPDSLGQRILEDYYKTPSNFSDSYHFIRNVLPGFYFRISNGEGTMLTTQVGVMNIYYNYRDKNIADSVYVGITRFTATPEVIQSSHITSSKVEYLVSETDHTYLKTPAGICTEMTLPVDEVFDNHPSDSVSKASITLTRYNKESQDKYQLGTPSTVLMVRKQNMESFFANHKVTDSRTSYTSSFSSTYNTYEFSNICRLLSYCKHEKTDGVTYVTKHSRYQEMVEKLGIQSLENPAEYIWINGFKDGKEIIIPEHKDWNKVVIIPVVTSSNTSGNMTSVTHDMSLSSIKLVGGDTKLSMQVIYTKFAE